MGIKWHWGVGITIVYSIFVLLVVTFLFYSFGMKTDLVEDGYYEKSLKYDEIIEKTNRSNRLEKNIGIEYINGVLLVNYPRLKNVSGVTGNILFYRPSDSGKDFEVAVKTDSSFKQLIDVSKREKGLWVMKFDWKSGDSSYYIEKNINFD
jgi:hypothetical protein